MEIPLKEIDKTIFTYSRQQVNIFIHESYNLLLSSKFYDDLLEFSNMNNALNRKTENNEINSILTSSKLKEQNKSTGKNNKVDDINSNKKPLDFNFEQANTKQLYFPSKNKADHQNPQNEIIKEEYKNNISKEGNYFLNNQNLNLKGSNNNIFGGQSDNSNSNYLNNKVVFPNHKKQEVTQKIGYKEKPSKNVLQNSNKQNEQNQDNANKNILNMNFATYHIDPLPAVNLTSEINLFEIDESEESKLQNELSMEIPFIKFPPSKKVSLPNINKSSNLHQLSSFNEIQMEYFEESNDNSKINVMSKNKSIDKNDPEFKRMYEEFKKNSSTYNVDLRIFDGSKGEDKEFNSENFQEVKWKERESALGYNSCIITQKGIPIAKWAENKENLEKLVKFQSEEIYPTSIFGKIDPDKIIELDKIGWLNTSKFRGSSANWKNEEFTAKKNNLKENELLCKNIEKAKENRNLFPQVSKSKNKLGKN